jgi:hypothetical protein
MNAGRQHEPRRIGNEFDRGGERLQQRKGQCSDGTTTTTKRQHAGKPALNSSEQKPQVIECAPSDHEGPARCVGVGGFKDVGLLSGFLHVTAIGPS